MAARRHTHKYHRIPFGASKVWACARMAENCTHHIPPYMENTIVGRKSICWQCDSDFVLNERSIERDRPICPECSGLTKIEDLLIEKETQSLFPKA